ncbi:MAG: hypothetical protein ACOYYU_00465 [Chloroflexota bacterium]
MPGNAYQPPAFVTGYIFRFTGWEHGGYGAILILRRLFGNFLRQLWCKKLVILLSRERIRL